MQRSEFGDFLARSLAVLEREMPRSHARLCAVMRDRCAAFRVDGPPVLLAFGDGGPTLGPLAGTAPGVECELSKQTILDLVDGRLSLEEAVRGDRFLLRAPVRELQVFFEALQLYFRGAVRCPSLPVLLEAYRRGGAAVEPETPRSRDAGG
jgi:hypothetical protein